MKDFCENDLCENPGTREVPVSVNKVGDEKRTFCTTCEEAYSTGVQHGWFDMAARKLWIVVVVDKGLIAHTSAHGWERAAHEALVQHLKTYHQYHGKEDQDSVEKWIASRQHTLTVQIVEQDGIQTDLPAPDAEVLAAVNTHLRDTGFVVLTFDREDPTPGAEFEAWAYEGPLDFDKASPVKFGLGADPIEALHALNQQLTSVTR